MNIAQIENNIKALVERLASGELATNDFIYELLLAYGHRNSTISMLKTGHYNIAKEPDEIIFKRHLYFKEIRGEALHSEIDRMKNEKLVTANRTRFVIVTDFRNLLAVDTKTGDSLDIALAELPKKFDFFLPWAGMEKAVYQGENPADVKAAEKMAKLFDLIKADNFTEETLCDKAALHNLNVFLTRLLFCFFAEDTEIFADNQFSDAIQAHTNEDGSDLAEYLNRLFSVLNTSGNERGVLPEYLANFPYVNGGLFADEISAPIFSRKSRRMLIECGSELNWSDINPDIFGSMIQAVVHPDQRGGMGMHYTSVTNIMKVIEPLFLNDLYGELEKASNSSSKLQKLQQRLGEIKIFDPACGSGNFLIISYKELRKMEMELLSRLSKLDAETDVKSGVMKQRFQPFSVIKLSQFFGIELDDFAHEVAILSLWLAEHQMNVEFKVEFGEAIPSLPLQKSGNIFCDNATRIDWDIVCSRSGETYILGNPPYLGFKMQNKHQKSDIDAVFKGKKNYKKFDYISCWLFKAAEYIKGFNAAFAFVATNSICQGENVSLLWPLITQSSLEIYFAHPSFKWSNSAKQNAGVTCVIVGIRNTSDGVKVIFDGGIARTVKHINAYLTETNIDAVHKRSKPLSKLTPMTLGNMPKDDGNLILSKDEVDKLIIEYPESKKYIRKLIGAFEFINGTTRYCIWANDADVNEISSIPPLQERIDKVREFRASSSDKSANQMALTPHKFREQKLAKDNALIVPTVTSERREYIPMSYLEKETIIVAPNNAIYDPAPHIFSIISSRMHMVWVRAVSGKLETRIRYSSALCYNTFPFPDITNEKMEELSFCALNVISEREKYSNKTIAKLYDPDLMPESLKIAHAEMDAAVEDCYRKNRFIDDEDRLNFLFDLYRKMTGVQNA